MENAPGSSTKYQRSVSGLRILIVADHASMQFGGEAALPFHYFRVLKRRGEDVRLLVHERTRQEIQREFGVDSSVIFVEDTELHRLLWRIGSKLPARLGYFTSGLAMRLLTQLTQRRLARSIVATHRIDVVHQPIPVSPKEPSALIKLGCPVIIGPMNGGMSYPSGFRGGRFLETASIFLGRLASEAVNFLLPGKRKAAVLMVANQRTRDALPKHRSHNIIEMVENGVDLNLWLSKNDGSSKADIFRVVYIGRLVNWKRVDIIIRACARAAQRIKIELNVVGDGPERENLQQLSSRLQEEISPEKHWTVNFLGWITQADASGVLKNSDCLVLASIFECGGAVVLEAMAASKPVIATKWGGPCDYVDSTHGILIDPLDESQMAEDFSEAIVWLNDNPEMAKSMGKVGREKVRAHFDWEKKIDLILDVYKEVAQSQPH